MPANVDALHRMAAQLRAAAGSPRAANGSALPALVLVTDESRLTDPVAASRRLPAGAAVLLRHYDHPERAAIARALRDVCRARDLVLWVGGDVALARSVGASGVHLPERMLAGWQRGSWTGTVTAAAHSAAALRAAKSAGADAAILSPVFITASHRDATPLGVPGAARLIAAAELPVYVLGGISTANAATLVGCGAAGIAALDGLAE